MYLLLDSSPSSSTKTSPKHATYEPKDKSKKPKKESGGGIGSYLKKIIGSRESVEPPTSPTNTNGSSMFYYDNLSSLRASKNTVKNETPRESSSKRGRSNFSSTLSPEVPEFVPASQRINKVPGSHLKKDNSWATVDDSALEYLRPPPGLSKPSTLHKAASTLSKSSTHNIWSLDENQDDRWGSSPVSKSSLFSDFKSDSSYSSLLGNTSPKTKVSLLIFQAYSHLEVYII